jgi:hypothetical protein
MVEKARDLGLPEPPGKQFESDFYFDISGLQAAYLTSENDMAIFHSSGDWVLEYDEKAWKKITKHLE